VASVGTFGYELDICKLSDKECAEVQEQIRRAQQEIGFTDLRFHGIFDDDMHIYQQNEDGSPWFNFTYTDMLFDFILSIGLTPYVELSFIPSQLAQMPYRLFERNSIMSVCTDREKWKALVQASVAHWIERYGLREVLCWHFAPYSYNFAQLSQTPLDNRDYLTMYCDTWQVLKELHSELQSGMAEIRALDVHACGKRRRCMRYSPRCA